MIKVSENQRYLNILQVAIENGFKIDSESEFELIVSEAETYLIELEFQNETYKMDRVVKIGPTVQWNDGFGYSYIFESRSGKFHKNFHDWVVNSIGRVFLLVL